MTDNTNTMKSPYIIVALFGLTTFGCGKDWTPTAPRQLTVILDKSNRHLLQTVGEDIQEILKCLGLDGDMWKAVDFRLVVLSEVAYNRSQELHLPAEDPDEGNIIVRKHKVKAFLERVAELIRLHVSEPRNEDASLVYLPVALELERLALCETCDREVVIYSDLVEHLGKGKWSLYDDELLDSLQHQPEAFIQHFERQRELPSLSGINCTVVNIPRNTPNSQRVSTVYTFYERMLQEKGATVEITGNYHAPSR